MTTQSPGYVFAHGPDVFSSEGKVEMDAAQIDQHNRELEQAELAKWATCPDKWAVHVTFENNDMMHDKRDQKYVATTWLGTILSKGRIEHNSFRTNMSRNMVSIRFVGTNGATYYGRYGADWTQLCRVRKAKGKAR